MVERLARTGSARIAVVVFLLSIALFVASVGVALYLRGESLNSTCEAIRKNNDILRELVVHVKHRSEIAVRTHVTKDLTMREVRDFYGPTIRRLDAVSC